MTTVKSDLLRGTLDLMILSALDAMGSLHGYAIARRIEQISDQQLTINQGTIYPALVKLQRRGWISAKWGLSATGRRVKFYTITLKGRRQVVAEQEDWQRAAGIVASFLQLARVLKGTRA
jgi:transcriptional regulator